MFLFKSKIASFSMLGCVGLFLVSGCALFKDGSTLTQEEYSKMINSDIRSMQDAVKVFAISVADIEKRVDLAIKCAEEDLKNILSIAPEERNFENTVRALDEAGRKFSSLISGVAVIRYVHPDKAIRDAASKGMIKIQRFHVD